ncbi:MAG: acyl-protein synthetase [Candidatus Izimaplasma sp.]|nr:acyl-protein synthetase [Candidatus Izimaplasma bacterium]
MKRKHLKKLFKYKNPYDFEGTNQLFCNAIKENIIHHYNNCDEYKKILDNANFDPSTIEKYDDLVKIPFIPTLYFKRHNLFSMPLNKMAIKATSSGTSLGVKSKVGMSYSDLWFGFKMIFRLFKYHKLWSLRRVNYFIFGYEPSKHTDVVIMKSAYGFSHITPAKKRYYAIKFDKDLKEYVVDFESMKKALIKASKQKAPIRTIGFPAYTYFVLKEMKEEGIKLQMPKKSLVTVGGGWKQFCTEKVDKQSFYNLVKEVLGIPEKNIIEFFGAVEHPVVFPDCEFHHLHIPIYSRVIIRNPDNFNPVPNGEIGLINLLSPLNSATPLVSVMTDDLGILHTECECGLKTPWLEIVGRVGIKDITTCAQGADEILNK